MFTRIMIPLDAEERFALVELAKQERRDPRNQAAVMIRRELERQGLLPPEPAFQESRGGRP